MQNHEVRRFLPLAQHYDCEVPEIDAVTSEVAGSVEYTKTQFRSGRKHLVVECDLGLLSFPCITVSIKVFTRARYRQSSVLPRQPLLGALRISLQLLYVAAYL